MDNYNELKNLLDSDSVIMTSQTQLHTTTYEQSKIDMQKEAIRRNYYNILHDLMENPNPPVSHNIEYNHIDKHLVVFSVNTKLVIMTPELFKLLKKLALKGALYE
jgi:hypothetical protein